MAVNKDVTNKCIFDPKNPRDNENYEILLDIIQSEDDYYSLFTSDFFLQLISTTEIFQKDFKFPLRKWLPQEIPQKSLKNKIDKKISKYIEDIKRKYSFLTKISAIIKYNEHFDIEKRELDYFLKNIKKENDCTQNMKSFHESYKKSYIIFSNCMELSTFNFISESIFITLEENKNEFEKYKSNESLLYPIYLKKMEDLEVLLETLEKDLETEKKEEIHEFGYLGAIKINNYFSIKNMELTNLKNKKEIYFVGENGDGKTILLQAIILGLKKAYPWEVKAYIESQEEKDIIVKDEFSENYSSRKNIKNVFAYGSSRNNSCQKKEDKIGYLTLFSNEYDLKSPIKWLQYLDYSEQKGNNIISVAKAKKLLQELLNSDIEIDINPDEVTFTEKGSKVSFEQLSSGYKGVITIICDLIARLSKNQQVNSIRDFKGIVLIDEVELHLHPKWQYSFMNKLRETFPLIQFIVTTHSPTVILGASMDAVYYKIYKDNGVVKISEQKDVKNDFLNDIQSDIFGFDVNYERIKVFRKK